MVNCVSLVHSSKGEASVLEVAASGPPSCSGPSYRSLSPQTHTHVSRSLKCWISGNLEPRDTCTLLRVVHPWCTQTLFRTVQWRQASEQHSTLYTEDRARSSVLSSARLGGPANIMVGHTWRTCVATTLGRIFGEVSSLKPRQSLQHRAIFWCPQHQARRRPHLVFHLSIPETGFEGRPDPMGEKMLCNR